MYNIIAINEANVDLWGYRWTYLSDAVTEPATVRHPLTLLRLEKPQRGRLQGLLLFSDGVVSLGNFANCSLCVVFPRSEEQNLSRDSPR